MFRWRRMIDRDGADAVTAQMDVEVFRLVDCEGLAPLLTLLNLAKGADSLEAARREQAEFGRL